MNDASHSSPHQFYLNAVYCTLLIEKYRTQFNPASCCIRVKTPQQSAQSMKIKLKTKQSMTKITKCIKGLETTEIKHYFSLLIHGRSLSIFIFLKKINFNNSCVLSTPRNHNFIKQDSKAHISINQKKGLQPQRKRPINQLNKSYPEKQKQKQASSIFYLLKQTC